MMRSEKDFEISLNPLLVVLLLYGTNVHLTRGDGCSVCHNFLKRQGNYTYIAPIGVLATFQPSQGGKGGTPSTELRTSSLETEVVADCSSLSDLSKWQEEEGKKSVMGKLWLNITY